MSSGGEELRFYLNLLRNNLFGRKYDLYKVPGPPAYPLLGGFMLCCVVCWGSGAAAAPGRATPPP